MVNPFSAKHKTRLSKRYCQLRTAPLLSLLMWTFYGTFGVSPYRCIIFRTFVVCSLVPVFSRIVFCRSLGVHLGWADRSIIRAMISYGIFGGQPVLERSRRPSGPSVSKRFTHLCTHLSDRIQVGGSLAYAHLAHADHVDGRHLGHHSGILFFPVRFLQLLPLCFVHAAPAWERIIIGFGLRTSA